MESGFTAVDLDAVLDEFEFHEGEANRHSSGGVNGTGKEEKKKKPSAANAVLFSPDEEDHDEDRIPVGEDFWKKNAGGNENGEEACKETEPPPPSEEKTEEAIISESPQEPTKTEPPSIITDKEDDDVPNEPPAESTSSSESSSSSDSEDEEETSIQQEHPPVATTSLSNGESGGPSCSTGTSGSEDIPDSGARPKEPSSEDDNDVPTDSPPPYSEIDPMKSSIEDDSGQRPQSVPHRPTSLAIQPEERNAGFEGGRQDENEEEDDDDVSSSQPIMGPPGSTPAIPNVSLVPDPLQGLSEEQLVLGKVLPLWVPDGEALSCMICDIKFTLTKRRHHCRACGKVLCNHCCSDRFILPCMDNKDARVCKPCKGILERLKRAEELANNSSNSSGSRGTEADHRPNPSNPMEYCSTLPPHVQVAASGGAAANPPSVMVPVGVLKRWDSVASPHDRRLSMDPKSVMFSDGVRPGGDLAADLEGSPDTHHHRYPSHRSRSSGSSRRSGMSDIGRSMLPHEGLPIVAGVGPANPVELEAAFQRGASIAFLINLNLKIHVSLRLYTPANGLVWNYRTEGMNTIGNDELVFLLTQKDTSELLPPRDVFDHIQKLFEEVRRGNSVHEMGHSVVLSGADFLGGSNYGGFLFIRHSFQCIQSLEVPRDFPFLFALLITKTEVPWARVFPLRLLLRLGAEFRYYPCPLWSSRERGPVYNESGNTIMKILSDFRNFSYSLPIIKGLVVHVEDKLTTVLLPKKGVKLVQKALQNSNDPVLALGANFSPVADSHYVAVQRDESEALKNPGSSSDYETQTINRFNRSRKVTGASFIVFNGALKSTSGLTAKSSIVEDGIMVQISQDRMMELRKKLHAMEDTEIGCGPVGASAPDEMVSIRWVNEDQVINAGIKSPIDNSPMDGVSSVRIHSGPDFRGEGGHIIRCTEIFFFPYEDEIKDGTENKVAEYLVKSVCQALGPHLKSLRNKDDVGVLGVRITLEPDNVGYDAGAKGVPLASEIMNSLDNELIPIIHNQAISRRTKFEMIFHILNT